MERAERGWRQAALLAVLTLVDLALLPVVFALAVLSPTAAAWGGGWGVAFSASALLLLVVGVCGPLLAWAAWSMRKPALAWASAGAPLVWGIASGVLFALSVWR